MRAIVVAVRSSLYLLFLFVTVVLFSVPLSVLGWMLPQSVLGRIGKLWGSMNLAALNQSVIAGVLKAL